MGFHQVLALFCCAGGSISIVAPASTAKRPAPPFEQDSNSLLIEKTVVKEISRSFTSVKVPMQECENTF